MTTETFWAKTAHQTAERYIKNVVVVDNEAYIRVPKAPPGAHALDVRELARCFAERSILCSTLAPSQDDFPNRAVEESVKLVLASDVAILDWQLDEREGQDKDLPCRDIIKRVQQQDAQNGNPLRLIVVYTGESITADLVIKLKSHLSDVNPEDLPAGEGFGLTIKNLRIVFIHKKQSDVDQDLAGIMPPDSGVEPKNLPDKIIEHFAELTKGILPTVTLNAVSAIREHASTLTGIFSRDLDPAFVYHTAIIPDSRDGALFLIEQIKEELGAALEIDPVIQQCFEPARLIDWFKEAGPDYFSPCGSGAKLTEKQFSDFINENSSDGDKLSEDESANRVKIFSSFDEIKKFACITSFKRESFSPTRSATFCGTPFLTQGTIIRLLSKKKYTYYLCLIPKCDSVRIDSTTIDIPLLKLYPAEEKPHICCNSDLVVSLAIPKNAWKNIEIKKFTVNTDTKKVDPKQGSNPFIFSTSDNKDFQWVGDLKNAALLSSLQRIFPKMTRLGVDEFEWLRLNRDGK